jgi:hypothetical protein
MQARGERDARKSVTIDFKSEIGPAASWRIAVDIAKLPGLLAKTSDSASARPDGRAENAASAFPSPHRPTSSYCAAGLQDKLAYVGGRRPIIPGRCDAAGL